MISEPFVKCFCSIVLRTNERDEKREHPNFWNEEIIFGDFITRYRELYDWKYVGYRKYFILVENLNVNIL